MPFCAQCGKPQGSGTARFCTHCGQSVSTSEKLPTVVKSVPQPLQWVVVLGVLGLIIWFFVSAANDPEANDALLSHREACVSDPNRSHILCPDLTPEERQQIQQRRSSQP